MKTTPCLSCFHRFTANRGVRNSNQYQEQDKHTEAISTQPCGREVPSLIPGGGGGVKMSTPSTLM